VTPSGELHGKGRCGVFAGKTVWYTVWITQFYLQKRCCDVDFCTTQSRLIFVVTWYPHLSALEVRFSRRNLRLPLPKMIATAPPFCNRPKSVGAHFIIILASPPAPWSRHRSNSRVKTVRTRSNYAVFNDSDEFLNTVNTLAHRAELTGSLTAWIADYCRLR